MANFDQTIHDARTGFHDITSIPEFYPSFFSLQTIIMLAIFIALLALILIIRKDKKTLIIPPSLPDPAEVALEKLDSIKNNYTTASATLRDLASQISLAIRVYYCDAYNFPADDRTEKEIKKELEDLLIKKIPALPREIYTSLMFTTSNILSQCELITFSEVAEEEYRQQESLFMKIVEDAKNLISDLDKYIKKENDRIRSVMENNLATTLKTS